MSRLLSRSEAWERAYSAFENISFTAFDFASVKRSLVDYVRLHFPESFNDYIESSELIAIIETFAYVAELMAYRIDVTTNENFISTAQRKDSVLRLAKLVSYSASRPLPARGLLKLTSVSTTESIIDTNGVDLANKVIRWNDPTNTNWKDQFVLVLDRIVEQSIGSVGPSDRFQVMNTLFELYSLDVVRPQNGVFSYTTNVNGRSIPMEIVPVERSDQYGLIERRPRNDSTFTMLYGRDGTGDGSEGTGFFLLTKQGTLRRFRTTFDGVTPNQTFDVEINDVNDTDVWVNNVDPITGVIVNVKSNIPYRKETLDGISGEWVQVDLAHAQNVIFNTNPKRNKYEVETKADSQVRIIFGDGEYADVPKGTFDVWVRSSINEDIVIPQSSVVNVPISTTYIDGLNRAQTFSFTCSLSNTLQNASAAETMDQVRATAPAVYYSQDRMVNGEDYNVFPLQDPSILKLRSINRTFAGDSKYLAWHDASSSYENVKIFGTDGIFYIQDKLTTELSPRVDINLLISNYIEPILSSTDIFLHIVGSGVPLTSFRRSFTVTEKTQLVSALTPPPSPAAVDMYFNFVTNTWHSIKTLALVSDELTAYGWPAQFIQYPLIEIRQVSTMDTRYNIGRLSRRIVIQSDTTKFWNTNQNNKILEYDTLRAEYDNVVLLQANINHNRDGILLSDYTFDVLGQEVVDSGANTGLVDTTRVFLLPSDDNKDGVPDNVSVTSYPDVRGMSNILNPKLSVDLTGVTIAGPYPSATGYVVTLPVLIIVDPTTLLASDVKVQFGDQQLAQGMDWLPVDVSVGTYVTNKIRIRTLGIHTSLGIGVDVDVVDIFVTEYVYFTRSTTTDPWVAVPSTSDSAASYVEDVVSGASLWKRHNGKSNVNFAWLHRSPRYHLIDPSPTNIIDMFVMPKGYFLSVKRWLEDALAPQPVEVSALELRNTYGKLLDNKMVSDAVILHPGKIKLLFGSKADPTLRCTFKVIRSADRTLTDNQIKTTVVSAVRTFFDMSKWEFGETFFFTELAAAIHNSLPTQVSSVVLVPTYDSNQFGDLFQVLAREDEILYPDITVDGVSIVSGLTPTILKQ